MDLWRGLDTPAWLVGAVRGLVLAAVTAAVAFLLGWFQNPPAELAFYAPIAIYLLRQLEALLDQADPAKDTDHTVQT